MKIETGARVEELPGPPVVVATRLVEARALLGDDSLRWAGTRCAVLEVGLRGHRGDAVAVVDLDGGSWVERFTAPAPSLARPRARAGAHGTGAGRKAGGRGGAPCGGPG